MTIKKTVTIEGVRSWTGPMENYEAHKECVDHWCGGGEIEYQRENREFVKIPDGYPSFLLNYEYRIKRRELVNGEVWITAGMPCIYSEYAGNDYELLQFDGGDAHHFNADAVYAAPSVEAYIAKKLLAKVEQYTEQGFKAHALYEVVEAAAGEE